DVEAVELDPPGGELGQVPAGRWPGSANPAPGIEDASSFERPTDRPDRGHELELTRRLLLGEPTVDGGRAVLAKHAVLLELLAIVLTSMWWHSGDLDVVAPGYLEDQSRDPVAEPADRSDFLGLLATIRLPH